MAPLILPGNGNGTRPPRSLVGLLTGQVIARVSDIRRVTPSRLVRLGDGPPVERRLQEFLVGRTITGFETGAETAEGFSVSRLLLSGSAQCLIVPCPLQSLDCAASGVGVGLALFYGKEDSQVFPAVELAFETRDRLRMVPQAVDPALTITRGSRLVVKFAFYPSRRIVRVAK